MLPCDSVPLAMESTTTEQRENKSPATETKKTTEQENAASDDEPTEAVENDKAENANNKGEVAQNTEDPERKTEPEVQDTKENVPNGVTDPKETNAILQNKEDEAKSEETILTNVEDAPKTLVSTEPEPPASPVKGEIILDSPEKSVSENNEIQQLPPPSHEPVIGSKDPNPYEDDGAISVSSSPGLQIQLDDDDESSVTKNRDEIMEESSNNSLPMIASVMSLSQNSNDDLMKDSALDEPRRTTLKLKRGIEISFPVDHEGQPLASSEVEREPPTKKSKPDMNIKELDESMQKLQKDIRTLGFLAHQKEKEWNYLIRLQKMKEEMLARLKRNREVLMIKQQTSQELRVKTMALVNPTAPPPAPPVPEPVTPSYSNKVPPNQVIPLVQDLLSKYASQVNSKNSSPNTHSTVKSTPANSSPVVSTSISNSNKQRPILPKPQNTATAHLAQALNSYPFAAMAAAAASHNVTQAYHDDIPPSEKNKQFVSVKSLIADYKAKHPEETPTRGRRINYPPQSQSRSSGGAANLSLNRPSSIEPIPKLPMNLNMVATPLQPDPSNVSFKDVLLQFAKLSRDGAHNSSIVPNIAPSGAAAKGGTSASGASILQSALSGSFNPKDPGSTPATTKTANYAPTLAQLLTSTPEHAATTCTTTAVTAQTPGELTLSNLLATSKGHVIISSDRRDSENDGLIFADTQRPSRSNSRNATTTTTVTTASAANANSTALAVTSPAATEIPQCQGCQSKTAQFVCAGCGSQWYCSRECQVAAWEEHSEHCLG